MNLPRITIITPSFNQGQYIEETINSVLDQNYPNLEYMIIDGGSTDETIKIINKYKNHLSYWISEKDNGQSHAINKGLQKATGSILSWLCSDDLYNPHTLHKAADYFLSDPEIHLIHGKSILFGQGKEITKGADQRDLHLRYFAHMPFPQPSSFFSKAVTTNLGMLDDTLHYGMDFDLLVRIALNYKVKSVPDVFSKYRLHPQSKSVSQLQYFLADWVKVFSKCANTIALDPELTNALKTIGMYTATQQTYLSNKTFNNEEKKKIVLIYLENLLHVYYELLDLKKSGEICSLIHTLDKHYYQSYRIESIHRKTKYLSKSALSLLRKIYRKKHLEN